MWEKSNGDGKGSGIYDFTSLMGSDKKLFLKKLPENLHGVIKPETSATVIQIWRVYTIKCISVLKLRYNKLFVSYIFSTVSLTRLFPFRILVYFTQRRGKKYPSEEQASHFFEKVI